MPLPVWGWGIPSLVITWGLGAMPPTTEIDETFYEPDVPEEVIVTFTPLPGKVKFKDRRPDG